MLLFFKAGLLWDPNRWLLLAQQFIYNNEDIILTTITVTWLITLAQRSINRLCRAHNNMYVHCKVNVNGTKNCSTCIARLIWHKVWSWSHSFFLMSIMRVFKNTQETEEEGKIRTNPGAMANIVCQNLLLQLSTCPNSLLSATFYRTAHNTHVWKRSMCFPCHGTVNTGILCLLGRSVFMTRTRILLVVGAY